MVTHKNKNVDNVFRVLKYYLLIIIYKSTKAVTCFAHDVQVNIAFSIHNAKSLHLCKLLFKSTQTTIFSPQIIAATPEMPFHMNPVGGPHPTEKALNF